MNAQDRILKIAEDFYSEELGYGAIVNFLHDPEVEKLLGYVPSENELLVFLMTHWNSTIKGLKLYEYIDRDALRAGGLQEALVEAHRMYRHSSPFISPGVLPMAKKPAAHKETS